MRAVLIVCPGWDLSAPPLGAPLLKAYLNQRGHDVLVVDLAAALLAEVSPADREQMVTTQHSLLMVRDGVRDFIRRYDAVLQREIDRLLEHRPDVAGFTAYNSTRLFSQEIAGRLKERRPTLPIVFGGPEGQDLMRASQEDRGEAMDAIIAGEGEVALAVLLETLSDGRLRPSPGALVKDGGEWRWVGPAASVPDLDALPFPDFTDLPLQNYLPPRHLATYFSRGCYKKCAFCDVEYNWGRWRNRSGERVFAEVRHLLAAHPDTTGFVFCDSITNADMKSLVDFSERVIDGNRLGSLPRFTWRGYAAVRPEMTREVLHKMHASGCRELWLGIESGSQKVLNLMRKGYRVENASRMIKDCAEVGIRTLVLLMAGYPGETEEDFEQTLDFVRQNARHMDTVSCCETFTYIDHNTYLRQHAFDKFGVDPDTFDSNYWQTTDGTNNYLVRCDRFEKLCRTAETAGVRFGSKLDIVQASKERWLEQQRNSRKTVLS